MGAHTLDATVPTTHVAPDSSIPDHALLLSRKRVSLDAGHVLWDNSVVQGETHGSQPAVCFDYC